VHRIGLLCGVADKKEMDLSAFSSTQFSTPTFINAALRERPEEEALESYLASLAMKLHIVSQDYTDQLETGMVEAMSTMPRVLSEVSRIEEVLRNVDSEMQGLAAQLKAFDQRNVAGVEDLSRLDTLKSNMEKCKATLEEHARWSQLVREAKAFLEGGGRLSDSADRVASMLFSLDILQNMPGHDERKETCLALIDSLLSALRPRVRRDVVGLDVSPLFEYLYVYEKLDRKTELEEEYVQARPERLKAIWDGYSHLNTPIAQFIASYLGKVAGLLAEEASNMGSLFGAERTPDLLCSMLEKSLEPVVESLASRLQEAASPEATSETYRVADEFSRRVLGFISGCAPKRLPSVLAAIYGPFATNLEALTEIEGAFVRTRFADAISMVTFDASSGSTALGDDGDEQLFGSHDPMEICGAFGERLIAAAEAVHEPTDLSLRRLIGLMGGLNSKQALRVLSAALSIFTKQLTGKVEELRVACGLPSDGSNQTARSEPAAVSSLALAESWARRLELHDVVNSKLVPCALRALQAAGRLARRVRELEGIANSLLMEINASLFRDSISQMALERAVALVVSSSSTTTPTVVGAVTESTSPRGNNSNGQNTASISSTGTAYAIHLLQQDSNAASELKSFMAASSSHHASQSVFSSVSAPLARLKAMAGSLFFDLCTAAPERMLNELASEDIWASTTHSQFAEENLLPQPAITQVGEHLLSLVQELELFASSDALPDLLLMMGEAQSLAVSSKGWKNLRTLLEIREEDGVDNLCRRAPCASAIAVSEKVMFGSVLSRLDDFDSGFSTLADSVADQSSSSSNNHNQGGGDEKDEEALALAFVNEWLGAVADAAIGLVFVQIVKIKKMTSTGRAQLIVDVDYIINVINSLCIRQHPLLIHVRQLLNQDLASLQSCIDILPVRSPVSIALKAVDERICKALCTP